MPRSSRGSTSHRGHRTRGRNNETTQQVTEVATPQEATAQVAAADGINAEDSVVTPAIVDDIKTKPSATPTSSTIVQANPLVTKELIRIAVLATVVLALLTTFTTLLK